MSTAVEITKVAATNSASMHAPEALRPAPLFVVGMWRSGTSLLYALLNQHPQIGLMYESDFALLSSVFLLPHKTASWVPKIDAWNGALSRHKIDPSLIPEDVSGLPDAFAAVAKQYAEKKDASVWGCKSPNYYDCMVQLLDWFPEAKFLVIWRDPADVCRSIVRAAEKSSWFARPGMDLRALLGCRIMKQEADELVRRGAAIHQLQYKDLVRDPVTEITAICKFIGVSYDPRMNTLEGADRSAIYNGAHHAGVKSSSIVAKRERPEVLSAKFKAKVERYIVYWRQQYNGSWPVDANIPPGTKAASTLERAIDQTKHAILRMRDLFVPYAYSFVPTSLWQKYRATKYRVQQITPPIAASEDLE
jgi:hypothetical protein